MPTERTDGVTLREEPTVETKARAATGGYKVS